MARFGIGVLELFILGLAAVAIVLFAVLARRRAKRFDYASTGAYLRAAPRSDAEKRDAADLALRGVVFCVLGLLFRPFILIGLMFSDCRSLFSCHRITTDDQMRDCLVQLTDERDLETLRTGSTPLFV